MRRKERWGEELRPGTHTGLFAPDRAVATSLRFEACENTLEGMFVEETDKAPRDWDHSRRVDALTPAERLAKQPTLVAGQLQEMRQGFALMLERWEHLPRSLEPGTWDRVDRSSALDLLGVPASLRKPGQTALDARDGKDATAQLLRAIDREAARSRERMTTVLDGTDALARTHAGATLTVPRSRPAALALRYEREANGGSTPT